MSKRKPSPSAYEPSKRTTLNSFFPSTSTPSLPSPIVSSSPITDRLSTFVAHACPITHQSQATLFHSHIRASRTASHPTECDHEMLAWRTMSLKVGKNGLGEDDWTVRTGGDDDGEKGGMREVHSAITKEAAVDVAVVVSRLYGGTMLGPVRFQHINQVATQALQRLAQAQSISPLISRLTALDDEIAEFSPPSTDSKGKAKQGNEFEGMSVEKLERLCTAREKKLEFLKKKFRQDEEALWKEVQEQENGNTEEEAEQVNGAQVGSGPGSSKTDQNNVKGQNGERLAAEEEEDDEEAELWRSLEGQDTSQVPDYINDEFGLPDEEDAAVAAATLEINRKKREKDGGGSGSATVGMGGGFVIDE